MLPCGDCPNCRAGKRRDWGIRAYHESQMHAVSCFVTLTFDDEHYPDDGNVSKGFLSLWFKKLRNELGDQRVRFLACGEYGELNGRAHYHAILFGIDFSVDRYLWSRGSSEAPRWRSPTLERLWPYGHCDVSDVTYGSACYVAGYTAKKLEVSEAVLAGDCPRRVHPVTGELLPAAWPPFLAMSRMPGLGATWFDKYRADAFPSDFLVVDGKRVPVPVYYRDRLADDARSAVMMKRKAKALALSQRLIERERSSGSPVGPSQFHRHQYSVLREAARRARNVDGGS